MTIGTPAMASSRVTVPDAAKAAWAFRKAAYFSASPSTMRGRMGQACVAASISAARCETAGSVRDTGRPSCGIARPSPGRGGQTRRQRQGHRPAELRDRAPERGAEGLHQPRDLRAAAAGQDEQLDRIFVERPPFARAWAQIGHPLDERMADIGAGRTIKTAQRFRLERLDGEDMIDVRAHPARAPGAPGPDRRADIVDDRQLRQPLAHALRDRMGEIRGVDDDERVGALGDDRRDGRIGAAQDQGQALQDVHQPHDRDVGEREEQRQPLPGHGVAADAAKAHVALAEARFEGPHQLGAELVAGFLAGDEPDEARARLAHRASPAATRPAAAACPGSTATRNSPRRSAVAIVSSWLRMSVTPLPTATPLRPARRALIIVRGPMAGRSTLRSWPCFAVLTRTPPGSTRTRLKRRRKARTRASMLSVPSGPSIARMRSPATMQAWPMSCGARSASIEKPTATARASLGSGAARV